MGAAAGAEVSTVMDLPKSGPRSEEVIIEGGATETLAGARPLDEAPTDGSVGAGAAAVPVVVELVFELELVALVEFEFAPEDEEDELALAVLALELLPLEAAADFGPEGFAVSAAESRFWLLRSSLGTALGAEGWPPFWILLV